MIKTIQNRAFGLVASLILIGSMSTLDTFAQPVVSNLAITVTDSSATITYDTDVNSTGVIDYGLTATYSDQSDVSPLATTHSILLDSLAENTVYHFQLTAEDELAAQTILPDSTFRTEDVSGPVMSNLVITTTDSSATITFDTDEPATSTVDYGLVLPYDSTQSDTNLLTSHSIVIDSLAENSLYHFALTLKDSLSNQTITADSTFRTDDVTGPVISNLVVVTTDSSATITFDTDEPATSNVDYGLVLPYDSTQSDSSLLTSHSIVINDLLDGTEYHYAITVTDSVANQTVTSDSTFMTVDVSGPVISNLVITTTDSSATITFDTDEPATSTVDYGLILPYDSTQSDSNLLTSHSIVIDSLAENTLYHFALTLEDSLLNQTVTADSTFMTADVTGPVISNLIIVTTDSSATISFDTDEPATSIINYGLTVPYDSTQSDTTLTTSHSIVVDSLTENTLYHFSLTVSDSLSNDTVTSDSTFMTLDVTGPIISNLMIVTTDTSATITFDTDEPATSVINYGLAVPYDSTQTNLALLTSHSIEIFDLDEFTQYHYSLTLEDSLANQTVTADSIFTTADVTNPVISGIVFSDTTLHTVRIQFTTDEPTTAEVEILDYSARDDTLRTNHDFVIDVMRFREQNRWRRMLSGETYDAEVFASDSSGNTANGGTFSITTESYIEEPLPAPWTTNDVGIIGTPGYSTYDSVAYGGSFRIVGTGTSLYFDVDSFTWANAPVDGDFILTAQVRQYAGYLIRNTKASTHFREAHTAGSRMFNQSVNFDNNDRLYYREQTDSMHVDIQHTDLQANPGDSLWVRLHRSGNDFTEYYSDDGINWTVHGPSEGTNVKLPTNGFAGMTSMSGSNDFLAEIIYSDVSLVHPSDTIPPVLVDFEAVGVLDTLNIDFEVDENVTVVLEYGYFVPYSDSLISDTLRADNSFQLTDLDEGVEYNYRIVMTDNGGNVVYDQNRTYVWGVLPVELAEFSAVQSGQDVLLRWSTVTESNSTQFDVQVAAGDGDFTTVGYVEAAGTSSQELSYSFVVSDLEPGGHRFRLKHIDTEGLSTLSDVVEIELDMIEDYTLSDVYPNPFNPTASMTLRVKKEQEVEVSVFDLLGRRVQTLFSDTMQPNQKYEMQIDGSVLSSGLYLVRVKGEGFGETRKVTLLK